MLESFHAESVFWQNNDPSRRKGFSKLAILVYQVFVLSIRGLLQNNILGRAAALSYGSLMALGPMLAISVVISTAFIRTDAETQIKSVILFIAPNLEEYIVIDSEVHSSADSEITNPLDTLISQIISGAEDLFSQINTEGSAAVGLVGFLFLIFIVIQLLTSVETALNKIWGVQRGRPWGHRIVFYWTIVTLGAILGLGSTVLFSASEIVQTFESIPLGSNFSFIVLWLAPWISAITTILLLTFFYIFFPHTKVKKEAAFIGSLVTTILIFLNQYLSILYVQRVISIQSLYGSVGIIPIMMMGIYVFWTLILFGAQLTYTIQSRDLLAKQIAWRKISFQSRESLTLIVFLHIAKEYLNSKQAPETETIAEYYRLPVSLVNEAVNMLIEMEWIRKVQMESDTNILDEVGYVPAKPLEQMKIASFYDSFAQLGKEFIWDDELKNEPMVKEIIDQIRKVDSDKSVTQILQTQ